MNVNFLINHSLDRDKNQEQFENIRTQMIKKESDYAQYLSNIANNINLKNSRKKSLENKEKESLTNKPFGEDELGFKNHLKKY